MADIKDDRESFESNPFDSKQSTDLSSNPSLDEKRLSDLSDLSSPDSSTSSLPMTKEATLPPLNYNLHSHSRHLVFYWFLTVFTSGIWPILAYFVLLYCTDANLYVVLGVAVAIPGVVSLFTDGKRTWRLLKKDSVFRPLGVTSRWAMDVYEWNFLLAAVVITAMLTVGTTWINYPLCSLPIAVLLLQVCPQLLLAEVAVSFNLKAPFRISSVAKGEAIRPACYSLVEDVVAVDGGGATAFRREWNERYLASPALRAHLRTMDLLWGTSGLVIAAVIFAVVFCPISPDIGYALGWALPWVWAGIMSLVTMSMTKRMLAWEKEDLKASLAA